MATRQEEPRQAAPDTAVRAWSPLWLVAIGLGLAVVAAIAATKSGSLPALPAKVALGLTITLLFATSFTAVGRDGPRGQVARSDTRAPADDAPTDGDDVRGSPEVERVYTWRHSRLAALGVTGDAAVLLAADTRFSIHELERLLAARCPLATAVRILQPA
jgi:hypothetical protein